MNPESDFFHQISGFALFEGSSIFTINLFKFLKKTIFGQRKTRRYEDT